MTSPNQAPSLHQVESYALGRSVLRSNDCVVEDFAGNLAILQEASGIDRSSLIARIGESPFFIKGEAHRNVRRRAARFFSPAPVVQWEETIDEIIDRILSPLECRDQIEMYAEVVEPVILHLRIAMFGLPEARQDDVISLAIREMNIDTDYIEEGFPYALQKAAHKIDFGAGAHICPDLSLSQLVIKRLLTELELRMPELRLCGDDALQSTEHGPVFLHNHTYCNLSSTNA